MPVSSVVLIFAQEMKNQKMKIQEMKNQKMKIQKMKNQEMKIQIMMMILLFASADGLGNPAPALVPPKTKWKQFSVWMDIVWKKTKQPISTAVRKRTLV